MPILPKSSQGQSPATCSPSTYWQDKAQARRGGWRVRESTLLWQAALGGSIGAWAACTVLRHKTRKQQFNSLLVERDLAVHAASRWIWFTQNYEDAG